MGLPGFEPGLRGPKPCVIAKLHYSPSKNTDAMLLLKALLFRQQPNFLYCDESVTVCAHGCLTWMTRS